MWKIDRVLNEQNTHIISYHIMLYHTISYIIFISYYITERDVTWCDVMQRLMPSHAIRRYDTCHVML